MSRHVRVIRSRLAIVASLALAILASAERNAAADATVNVNTTSGEIAVGDGTCSLREALLLANGVPGGQDCGSGRPSGTMTILLPAGHFALTQGVLTLERVDGQTAIQGAGPAGTTIDAQHAGRAILVENGVVAQITGLTITGGQAASGGDGAPGSDGGPGASGGGISNFGILALSDVAVTGNAAGDGGTGGVGTGTQTGGTGGAGGEGGGIFNAGTLSLTRVSVSNNVAGAGGAGGAMHGVNGRAAPPGGGGTGGSGGGIFNDLTGNLTLTDTTIAGNAAGAGGQGGLAFFFVIGGAGGDGGPGGGVLNAGTMTVTGSTLSGNRAGAGGDVGPSDNPQNAGASGSGGDGGGIFNERTLTATDTTIAANAAGDGGRPNPLPGTGGGIGQSSRRGAALTGVTLAQNTAFREGSGIAAESGLFTITSSVIGANGMQACSGQITDGGFDVSLAGPDCPGTHADPRLGALRDNGGSTQTMALLPGSPAIDLVPVGGSCWRVDQRGVSRPQGAACDAGAYELAPPAIGAVSATATGPGGATVEASINPNLQATVVTVHYGPTTALGSSTVPQDVGAGNAPVQVTIPLPGPPANTTIHVQLIASNADGTSQSAGLSFATPPAGGPAAPVITALRQSARRWVESATRSRAVHRRRLPVGTTFRFALSEDARVTLTFVQLRHGRGRRIGLLAVSGRAGTNRVRFLGRLAHHRALPPGRYVLLVTATSSTGQQSAQEQLAFTIVASRFR